MALKIPWDKHETALLIDACCQVENGEISYREAVCEVSKKLRQRAIDNGLEIDDIYRNENGFSIQLWKIQQLMRRRPEAKNYNPKIFVDMVNIFFTDRAQFDTILSEAKTTRQQIKINHTYIENYEHKPSPETVNDIGENIVNFNTAINYKYTKPVSVTYFDNTFYESSWRKMYICICHLLFNDYPDVFFNLRNDIASEGRKSLICDAKTAEKLIKPEEISKGYFVETNRDASSLVYNIKILLNACKVDYKNLVIRYRMDSELENSNGLICNIHYGRVEFERWLDDIKCPSKMIKIYADAVENIGHFLLKNNIEDRNIYSIRSVLRLEKIRINLFKNKDFQKNSPDSNILLDFYALKKYIRFRKNLHISGIDEVTAKRFFVVLRENFENGFRLNSIIDINRFKQHYAVLYNSELMDSDEKILRIIQKLGTLQNGRIFARKESGYSDLLDDIQADIAAVFKSGASCIYCSELYSKYQYDLEKQLQIFTQDVMEELLIATSYGEYYVNKHYFFTKERKPDVDADVRNFMQQSPIPLNYDNIHDNLWYIPLDKIKHCLISMNDLVNVASETYFYAPNLPVSAEELSRIAELIHRQLAQKNFITDIEMRNMIEKNCPSVKINIENYTTWGLRNCLAILLQNKFSFNGSVISEYGQAINMKQVFKEFSSSHEVMTLDELKVFAKDINKGNIYWDSIMDVMVRISQDKFVSKGQIRFNISVTDKILEKMFEGNYMALKNLCFFLHYPPINVQWNKFVLESYIAGYSEKFMLIHANYTENDCCGAVVRKESYLKNFQDLVTDVLAHSNEWQIKNDALSLLVNEGYLHSKRYNIDSILSTAKLQREKTQSLLKE